MVLNSAEYIDDNHLFAGFTTKVRENDFYLIQKQIDYSFIFSSVK